MASARVDVIFAAQTGKFDKNIKGAGKSVKGFSSGIGAASLSVGKMAKGLAVAAVSFVAYKVAARAAKIAISNIKQSFEELDDLGKRSQRIGVGVEQLEAFDLAAKLGGVSVSGFNKGLQRMLRSTSEAALGLDTPLRSFKQLGIEIREFGKLNTAEKFNELADAIAKIENPAERARIAADLFGRSGIEMLTILRQGSKALKQAEADIKRFGLGVTEQGVAAIQHANDELLRMRNISKQVFNKFATEFAPIVSGLARTFIDEMARMAGSTSGLGDGIASFANIIRKVMPPALDVVDGLIAGNEKLAAVYLRMGAFAIEAIAPVIDIFTELSNVISGIVKKVITGVQALGLWNQAVADAKSSDKEPLKNKFLNDTRNNLIESAKRLEADLDVRLKRIGREEGLGGQFKKNIDAAIEAARVSAEKATQDLANRTELAEKADKAKAAAKSSLPQLPQALSRGSAESIAAVNRLNRPDLSRAAPEVKATEKVEDAVKHMDRTLEKMRDDINSGQTTFSLVVG